MNLLLVEDDKPTAETLRRSLEQAGHLVELASQGDEGLRLATRKSYDIIVLDRMLPRLDGLSLMRKLRASGTSTPILLLTALGGVDDRVEGLNAGGDDYLVKPFEFSELLARVNALGRRLVGQEVTIMHQVADLRLNKLEREVRRGDVRIELQPREFQLLEYLMRHAGRIVTRTMLLEGVWNFHFDPQTNIVESHISRLRSKIDRGGDPELIHTVRGAGYCLRAPE
jgi:two-component system OmpR family response regulator